MVNNIELLKVAIAQENIKIDAYTTIPLKYNHYTLKSAFFYLQHMQFILQKEISQDTKMYIEKAICTDKDFFI